MIARAFGLVPEDLETDFQSADRPALVTGILERCRMQSQDADPRGAEDCWALRVGARIAGLLSIVARTCGDGLNCSVSCTRSGCGATLEFSLSVGELESIESRAADPSIEVPLPTGDAVRFRLPSGADLRRWRRAGLGNPADARVKLLQSLAVEGGDRLPAESGPWIEVVARAMETADPLVAFRCEVQCPECGTRQEHVVDLEGLALTRLAASQREIIGEVHHFATHYGWSEAETLAVSGPRRRKYRGLIRAEEGR